MGVSRAILIPTLSVSKRALIPSDGAARGFDVPYRADDVKIVARVTLSPMNSQPGKLSVLPGRDAPPVTTALRPLSSN